MNGKNLEIYKDVIRYYFKNSLYIYIEEFFIAHATFSEENNRQFFRALFYIEKIKSSLYFLLIS